MAYFVDVAPSAGAPGEVHATKLNDLGAIRHASDGNDYIYLAGAASVVANDWVYFVPGTWTAIRLVAGARGSVGIASAAILAANWGWFGYVGSFTAVCESSIVSNANLYVLSAGRCDDAIVKNDQVKRAKTMTAGVAGATATVSIDGSFIGSYDESA